MSETSEIRCKIPGYAQAQLDRNEALHVVPGRHRIIDERIMQVVGRSGPNEFYVTDEDGSLIKMSDVFYAAFAVEVLSPVQLEDEDEQPPVPGVLYPEDAPVSEQEDEPQPDTAEPEAKPSPRRKADKASDAETSDEDGNEIAPSDR